MRILIVNKFAHVTGGADRYCLTLTGALRERGHEVRWLSTADPKNLETRGAFVPLGVANSSRHGLGARASLRVARDALWNRAAAVAAERLMADFRPDVVHLSKLYPQLSVAPAVIARRRGIPAVQTIHDYEFVSASSTDPGGGRLDRDEEHAAYRALNSALFAVKRRRHLPAVRSWIAISQPIADVCAGRGIASEVVRHGVVQQPLPPVAGRAGVVFAGRLTAAKGTLLLAPLARALPDVPVTVLGDGPLRVTLAESAESLPNLELRGQLSGEQVLQAMATARVVVVPSLWREPAGLVALEAFSVATPVVAYDVGGLGDYVRRAGGGVVVSPQSDEVAQQTRALLDGGETWQRYSQAGWQSTAGEFSLERHVDRIEAIYTAAAAQPEQAP